MFETLWIEFYSDILVKSWAHNQSDTKRRLEVTDSQYSNILTPWNDQKLLLSKTSSTKRYKFSGLEWILHFNSKTISSWCYLLNCSMDTIAGRDIIPYVVVLPWIVCSAINISSSCWASNVAPTSGCCCCCFFPPWSPNGSELVQEILGFRSPWTQSFLHCICHHITSHHTNMQTCWILLSHYLLLLTWINAIELPFVSFELTLNLKPAASISCRIAPPTFDAIRRMNLRAKSWFWKAFLGFWFLVAHYVSSFTHYFSSVSFFLY